MIEIRSVDLRFTQRRRKPFSKEQPVQNSSPRRCRRLFHPRLKEGRDPAFPISMTYPATQMTASRSCT
jgi:hypothetical protein